MARVLDVPVLLAVAVPAHADGLASLNGSAVAVVAGDLSLVHMLILPRAHFLWIMHTLKWSSDGHVMSYKHHVISFNVD